MNAFGVIPEHECPYCAGSGWATVLDLDGESAHEIACPEGCPAVPYADDQDQHLEVPY